MNSPNTLNISGFIAEIEIIFIDMIQTKLCNNILYESHLSIKQRR